MKINKDTKALVITHFAIRTNQGPAAPALIRYLSKRVNKAVYIELPFPYAKVQYIYLSIYKQNRLAYQLKIPNLKVPVLIQFILHFFITIFLIFKAGAKFDFCVSCENLSFISALPFRFLGLIQKIAYYTIDYSQQRFSNTSLNNIYHFLDYISCKFSDANWVVAKAQIQQRQKNGLTIKTLSSFSLVPIGYDKSEIDLPNLSKVNLNQLVFAGGLLEHSNPQLAIEAMPKLLKKFSKLKLVIAGSGPYENKLKKLVDKLKLKSAVKFTGYVEDYFDLIKIISHSAIGIATYPSLNGSLSFNSDPSKVKLYLICGIPVIISNITTIAPTIVKRKAGIAIGDNIDEFVNSVIVILKNNSTYSQFRENVINLSKLYNSNQIFYKALKKL